MAPFVHLSGTITGCPSARSKFWLNSALRKWAGTGSWRYHREVSSCRFHEAGPRWAVMQVSTSDGRAFEHIALHRLLGFFLAWPFELIALALAKRASPSTSLFCQPDSRAVGDRPTRFPDTSRAFLKRPFRNFAASSPSLPRGDVATVRREAHLENPADNKTPANTGTHRLNCHPKGRAIERIVAPRS